MLISMGFHLQVIDKLVVRNEPDLCVRTITNIVLVVFMTLVFTHICTV